MGFFDFLRPKADPERPKPVSLAIIKSMMDLTVPKTDADKLNLFLQEQIRNHAATKSAVTERDLFTSQELIDFMYEVPIYFYGFFDWKEKSRELDTYLRKSLRRNFAVELPNTPVCNLDDLPAIDQVYQLYGTELEKYQVTLCLVDIDSDSYQIMLVRTADYPRLTELVKAMGYQPKHFTESW